MRVITRLDETCRQVRDAARVIGDAELFKKMEEAQNKIKRDSEYKLMIKVRPMKMTGCCLSYIRCESVLLSEAKPRLSLWREQHTILVGS